MPKIYPYHSASKAAKELGRATGWGRIKRTGSTYEGNDPNMWIVNWGCRAMPGHLENCRVVNNPFIVNRTANKLKFLRYMTDVGVSACIPKWTSEQAIAQGWLNDGKVVVERHALLGHSGAGIIIADPNWVDVVAEAPLYTQYLNKKTEYRIHYVRQPHGDPMVIDFVEKKRKKDVPDDEVDWRIRNLAGGFIYAREGVNVPQVVYTAAEACMQASGLDFGAVDVVYKEPGDAARVLEINTAPGLKGQTITAYAKALTEFCV